MNWYWIVLIIAAALFAVYLIIGYVFFLYMCKPDPKGSASLDGDSSRTLHSYVPLIKEKAKQNIKRKHQSVSCTSFDGLTLRAKLYPNGDGKKFLIFCHGFHSSTFWDFAMCFEWYAENGYTLLAHEMRGHGSDGKYLGFGVLDAKDVSTWMRWLVENYGEDISIGLVGFSMGAATVLMTSGLYAVPQLKCVIEDSGFSNLSGVIQNKIERKHYPKIPVIWPASVWCKLLAGYTFYDACPEKAVQHSSTPTLFIHGTGDTFVPHWMVDRLYINCAAEKERADFEKARHGEASFLEPERYRKLVLDFAEKYMR